MEIKNINYDTIDLIMKSNDRLQIRELSYLIQSLRKDSLKDKYFWYFMDRYFYKSLKQLFINLKNENELKYYIK